MKKAKLMLLALAIFAVAGTSLAFKASNFETHFIYTGTSATDCTSNHKVEGAKVIYPCTPNIYASVAPNTVNCPFTCIGTTLDVAL